MSLYIVFSLFVSAIIEMKLGLSDHSHCGLWHKQGDFLLIVLKNLLEKQAASGNQTFKVILMWAISRKLYPWLFLFYCLFCLILQVHNVRSATVDSNLFSRYFGDCPVITAKGRTYPVSTFFLEDVYEKTYYHLPSDSPACLGFKTFGHEVVFSSNLFVSFSFRLSSWLIFNWHVDYGCFLFIFLDLSYFYSF